MSEPTSDDLWTSLHEAGWHVVQMADHSDGVTWIEATDRVRTEFGMGRTQLEAYRSLCLAAGLLKREGTPLLEHMRP